MVNESWCAWAAIGQHWVHVWGRHDALMPIEFYFPWKSPTSLESKITRVLAQQQLSLHVAIFSILHQHIIVVLDTPEHPRVI